MMETRAHRWLKRLAVGFLRQQGCLAVAEEVRCPISRYRVDVAGFRDRGPDPAGDRAGGRAGDRNGAAGRTAPSCTTAVIECKRSRGDFLRDQASPDRLLAEQRDLERIARSIEEHRIMVEEPHLRRAGTSLFPQLDEWDFGASRLPCYRRTLLRLRRLSERLYGDTKFCTIARYGLADALYLAAPRGLVRRHELPPGWGLLECPPLPPGGLTDRWLTDEAHRDRLDEPPSLTVAVAAPAVTCRERHRARMLRNIAVAASFAAYGRREHLPAAAGSSSA